MNIPVLLTVFNRPDTTMQVLNAIRAAGIRRLFIAADGPRPEREHETELCMKLRQDLLAAIDWDCEVKTLFRDHNLGCGKAMSSAVDWFFSEVEEGIILEDDCLPSPDFFRFCREALEFYRNDERVMCINGTQQVNGWSAGAASCGFSCYAQIWGWASWRRAWKHYDFELKEFSGKSLDLGLPRVETKRWAQILEATKARKWSMDTWDFQWSYVLFVHRGLAVFPVVNLISNIGFETATHQMSSRPDELNFAIAPLPSSLQFPLEPVTDEARDRKIFRLFYQQQPFFKHLTAKLRRMFR